MLERGRHGPGAEPRSFRAGRGELHRQLSATLAALGRMAAQVAHELRNPLGGLKLFAEYLEDRLAKAGDTEGSEVAGKISREVDHMTDLVREISQFGRPGSLRAWRDRRRPGRDRALPGVRGPAVELEALAARAERDASRSRPHAGGPADPIGGGDERIVWRRRVIDPHATYEVLHEEKGLAGQWMPILTIEARP